MLAILMATSCNNLDVEYPQNARLPKVDQARLSFVDSKSYNLFIQATINEDIEQIVHDLPGDFKSLKDHNKKIYADQAQARTSSSAGANKRSQNRFSSVWWAENADCIYLKYEAEIEQKDAFGNYWGYPIDPVVVDRNSDNELSRTFVWATAIVGYGCDPVTGSCKPKFKAASPFKIKRMETCHYVMDEGRHGELSLKYQ